MKKIMNNPVLIVIILVLGCLAIVVIGSLSNKSLALETPTPTPTSTPTTTLPPPFKATVSQPSFCHNGPNESYLHAIIVSANTVVEVLAMNSEGDWFMIRGEGIDTCWIKASALILPPNIDLVDILKFVTVITIENTPCLIYPSAESMVQTVIPKDWRIVLYGKNNPYADWVLVVPHNSTNRCWVAKNTLPSFENDALPIEPADIPTATPTSTSTNTPTATLTSTPTATKPPFIPPTNTRRSNNGGGGNNNPTSTPIPPPTNTPIPPPTNTPLPPPTDTPVPPPTATPTLCWPPGHCK